MFILLDANVTAGYYLPRSLTSAKAGDRIQKVFDAVRTNQADHFFYIPNFCIAEVFGVFMKHAFGAWNTHVKTKGTIDKRVYESLVRQFSQDIHNGRFLCQYELSRYHILGINLVLAIRSSFREAVNVLEGPGEGVGDDGDELFKRAAKRGRLPAAVMIGDVEEPDVDAVAGEAQMLVRVALRS